MWRIAWVLAALVGLLVACSREGPVSPPSVEPAGELAERLARVDGMMRGAQLFQVHCAQCHGPTAGGHPDWQTPGVVAAPPLNGTGNDWKRQKPELIATIRQGVKRNDQPVMPAWGERLSDADIEDIIAWFQALWPAERYSAWRRANGRAGG